MKFSSTERIAQRVGKTARTVRNYLQDACPHHGERWWVLSEAEENAVVEALSKGGEIYENQPRRHAPLIQLSLF